LICELLKLPSTVTGMDRPDVAIIGAGVNVGAQVSGEDYVHAAIAGPDTQPPAQLRARFHTCVDAAVAGLYV